MVCVEIAVLEAVVNSERLLVEEGVEEDSDKVEGVELVYIVASGWWKSLKVCWVEGEGLC